MKFNSDSPEYYGLVIQPIKAKLPDYQRKKKQKKERRRSRRLREKRKRLIGIN